MQNTPTTMFEFITSTENFELVCDIVREFPDIKSKLIQNYWKLLLEKCKECEDLQSWKFDQSPDLLSNGAEFWLYKETFDLKETYPVLCLCFADVTKKSYFGLWISAESEKIKTEDIRLFAKENKLNGWAFGPSFVYWKYWHLDFNNLNDIAKLIPSKLEETVNESVMNLINAKKELEPIADVILSRFTN